MLETHTSRSRFVTEAFLRPASAAVAVPYAIWGVLAFVRDEIIQPRDAALWKPIFWLSKLPWYEWLVATFTIALCVLFEGAYRVLREREVELLALQGREDTFDVRLEGTFPGTFTLRATGHVSEIRTGPIVQESGIVGLHKDAERSMPVVTPRCVLEFPMVSDLHDGEKNIAPRLFYESTRSFRSRSEWPKPGSDAAIAEFLRNAAVVRKGADNPELKDVTDEYVLAILKQQRQPFHFPFTVTFWNGERTQQWTRQELLIYETETKTAFVRHSGRATISDGRDAALLRGEASESPSA